MNNSGETDMFRLKNGLKKTHMLQLFCNSGTDKLDDAFWLAA